MGVLPEEALGPNAAASLRAELAMHVDKSRRFRGCIGSLRRCSASPLMLLPLVRVGLVFPLASLCGAASRPPERKVHSSKCVLTLSATFDLGTGAVRSAAGITAVPLLRLVIRCRLLLHRHRRGVSATGVVILQGLTVAALSTRRLRTL